MEHVERLELGKGEQGGRNQNIDPKHVQTCMIEEEGILQREPSHLI